MKRGLALAGLLLAASVAHAEEGGPEDPARFRVGVNLGIISIPRLINFEGYARIHPYIGISGGWSTFPKFTSDAILKAAGAKSANTDANVNDFSAWEVAVRIYPMRGIFYLGVGFGQQLVDGDFTQLQAGTPFGATVTGRVQSWLITPRIGWQWVWASGFAMGVDLGVQFVISHSTVVEPPPGASGPAVDDARALIDWAASQPLPVIRFSIGYHFG